MSAVDNKELDRMLQQAFDASTKIYQERGFQRRIGFGKRPAVISVDLANAWTRPEIPSPAIRTPWTTPSCRACNAC